MTKGKYPPYLVVEVIVTSKLSLEKPVKIIRFSSKFAATADK